MKYKVFGEEKYFLDNAPMRVEFAGLSGTTLSMGQAGWEISLEQGMDYMYNAYRLRLAGRHQGMGLRCISMPINIDIRHLEMRMGANPLEMTRSLPPIQIYTVAQQINIEMVEYEKPWDFKSVDYRPMLTKRTLKSLDDLYIFKPINENTEILVPEYSIPELQEMILKIQEPIQKEIRERRRREECRSREGELLDFEKFKDYKQGRDIKFQIVTYR